MKIYYCEHIIDEDKNGEMHWPYIYKSGGVGAPHICARVNGEGYLFIIADKHVPERFATDENIKYIGDTDNESTLNTTDKTLLQSTLKLPTDKIDGLEKDMWPKILVNKSIGLDMADIEKRLSKPKGYYLTIRNAEL